MSDWKPEDDEWETDEDGLVNLTYEVYVSVAPRPNYNLAADIDDVIKAGIAALGIEGSFVFVESSQKDSDW